MQFDVDIPSGSFSAAVVDAADGHGVANARVTVTNDWNDPESGNRRVMTQVSVGDDGKAPLPPLRPGVLRLRADATGYLSGEREYPIIGTEDATAPFEIALTALDRPTTIHIALPDGTPAIGAEVFAVSAVQKVVYSAAADEKGIVEIPGDLRGVFLIARHPAAASDIQPVETSFENNTWHLSRLAPPLAIRVLSGSSQPLRSSAVFLWTPCCRIGGLTLALFARSASVTSSDGTWTGFALPATPLKILFVNSRDAAAVESGAYDQLATPIAYPWPTVTTVVGF
jgi:hypothetical protein